MARIVLTVVMSALLTILFGCAGADRGRAQLIPAPAKTSLGSASVVKVANAGEIDIVEQVTVNRRAYRQALELLIRHYTKAGNDMKLQWAKKELAALNAIPQYKYIIEAEVAGPNLKADASIPEADALYDDAVELEREAKRLILIKDNDLLRLVLDKYNELIRKHPSSDKIDDAAYRAGRIYEHFKDYRIALLYYKRTYQWNPETTYPARFREAYILDQQLHRRAEALRLYKQALQTARRGGENRKWIEWAEGRVKELSEGEKGGRLD